MVTESGESQQANSMLSDLLDEFKEGIEEPTSEEDDPETHYNLGVAFREMGLLDEAIGELQKVCRAVDSGSPFSQPMQAYTWLAQCLVDKGAPQAAIRWYERALKADPNHVLTWQYYGLWQIEQGNRDKALYHLSRIAAICGTDCAEYRSLAEALEKPPGTRLVY